MKVSSIIQGLSNTLEEFVNKRLGPRFRREVVHFFQYDTWNRMSRRHKLICELRTVDKNVILAPKFYLINTLDKFQE